MALTDKKSDEQLCDYVKAGDVASFAELMRRYEDRLKRYATYLLHDATEANDVVQETFIKSYQHMQAFNHHLSFSAWIYRIAHNQAMNHIKARKRYVLSTQLPESKQDSEVIAAVREIDRRILKSDVVTCLDQLDKRYREVLMLHYFEHMKYSEIADVLRLPPSTVGVRVSRAKAMMRTICRQNGVVL